jgi:hypothetical protein
MTSRNIELFVDAFLRQSALLTVGFSRIEVSKYRRAQYLIILERAKDELRFDNWPLAPMGNFDIEVAHACDIEVWDPSIPSSFLP